MCGPLINMGSSIHVFAGLDLHDSTHRVFTSSESILAVLYGITRVHTVKKSKITKKFNTLKCISVHSVC